MKSDPGRRLVLVHMSGFLNPAEVRQFDIDKVAAADAMGLESGEFDLLVDTTDCVIQSQDVVAELTRFVIGSRCLSRRLAVVRRNSLTRMQARRILNVRHEAMVFEAMADAEAWLASEPADPMVLLV